MRYAIFPLNHHADAGTSGFHQENGRGALAGSHGDVLCMLGQITQEKKKRILDILRPCCPEIFFTPPLVDDQPVLSRLRRMMKTDILCRPAWMRKAPRPVVPAGRLSFPAIYWSHGKKTKTTPRSVRRDRQYRVQYVDAAGTVLRNRLAITDLSQIQMAEEEALARAYRDLLREVRTDTPITCDLLRHVHARIFGDLYDWAGHWRSVWISKPGTTWPAPDFLDANMLEYEQNVLRKFPAGDLSDDSVFCAAVGEIQGEFLVIHPFREGNAHDQTRNQPACRTDGTTASGL